MVISWVRLQIDINRECDIDPTQRKPVHASIFLGESLLLINIRLVQSATLELEPGSTTMPKRITVNLDSGKDSARPIDSRPRRSRGAEAPDPATEGLSPTNESLDRHAIYDSLARAMLGKMSNGISLNGLALAAMDWCLHMAVSPGKQTALLCHGANHVLELMGDTMNALINPGIPCCFAPHQGDYRFREDSWKNQPYRAWATSFLLTQQWWERATQGVPGVSPHHEQVLSFVVRQWLDSLSPANLALTNPTVVGKTVETGGMNLVEGLNNFWDDARTAITGEVAQSAGYRVGKEVAITPGAGPVSNSVCGARIRS